MDGNKDNNKKLKNRSLIDNIHSKYILKVIFGYIIKRHSFQIIRYNKTIQRKADITLEDYHKQYKLYSKIELEIIPMERRDLNLNDIIRRDYNKSYYHIYINNNKKELGPKSDTLYNAKVKKIKIIIDTEFESLKGLFMDCIDISKLKFLRYKRIDVTDMSDMFSGCINLVELDFSKFINV